MAEIGAVKKEEAATKSSGLELSILFFACFLATAFPCQRFLGAFLLTRFQIKRMTLDLLDDVLLLDFALEPTQGIFEGLSLLDPDFCQTEYTPKLVRVGRQ